MPKDQLGRLPNPEQSTGWPDSSSHSGVSHAAMYVFLLFMGATAIPLELANFRQIFIFLVQIDLCLSLAIRFVPKDMIIDKSLFASFSLHRTQFANPISGFTKMSKFFFLPRLKWVSKDLTHFSYRNNFTDAFTKPRLFWSTQRA